MAESRVQEPSDSGGDEQAFGSTQWGWRYVKIGRPAGGQRRSGAAGATFHRLPKRNPREPLTVKVKHRGGPECWVEIHARGAIVRVPGNTAIHDLVMLLNSNLKST